MAGETSCLLPKQAPADLESQQRKSLAEAMDRPELASADNDVPELRDEENREPVEAEKTIMHPEVERDLEEHHPQALNWFQSCMGMMSLYGVVVLSTLMNIYEIVLKQKAGSVQKDIKIVVDGKEVADPQYSYDFSSVSFWSALLAIVIGLGLAAKDGRLGEIFCKKGMHMCLVFQPAAVGFALSQFCGFFGIMFLDGDVLKVLDQSRLLVTAIVMVVMLGKRYSRATWNSLGVISVAAVMYVVTKQLTASNEKLEEDLAKHLAGETVKDAGKAGTDKAWIGILSVLVNAAIMAFAGVYAEKYMKAYKATPFYIQKIYLEIGNVFTSMLFMYLISPALNNAFGKKSVSNPIVAGWGSNVYVIPLFVMFFAKSYLQGILVKRMSSLVKAVAAVVATCMAYFFSLIHVSGCKNPKDFFGGKAPQWQMVLVDFLVFAAVIQYIFAGRDKDRKRMYRAERDALQKE